MKKVLKSNLWNLKDVFQSTVNVFQSTVKRFQVTHSLELYVICNVFLLTKPFEFSLSLESN